MTTAKAKSDNAVKAGVKQVEEVVANGKETVAKAVAVTKEQVEKASDATLKGYDDFAALNKENMNAIVESANVFSKGFEELGKAYFAFAQTAVESSVEASKSLMAAKTVTEVVDLQVDMVRNNVDAVVAEGTKLSEMSFKLANETIQPLQDRFNANIEKALKPAAA
ncbi:phasin family protein [Aestuariispira insulae]|uniref:Phasin family protein n=1 Tax=Aestuariispira insulae TaxID=1461337 RepID=A0A3D9HWX2_9PROT|nr:phasin family protein [Aestuariispira insulae]RED53909.1 phasin family protein [Aestuariispira insulae]